MRLGLGCRGGAPVARTPTQTGRSSVGPPPVACYVGSKPGTHVQQHSSSTQAEPAPAAAAPAAPAPLPQQLHEGQHAPAWRDNGNGNGASSSTGSNGTGAATALPLRLPQLQHLKDALHALDAGAAARASAASAPSQQHATGTAAIPSPAAAAAAASSSSASAHGLYEEHVPLGHSLGDMSGPEGYWELLNNPEQEQTIFGHRARSASDANILRRKGHLKEQDHLIEYMQRMHETHTCEEVMAKMERWIADHRRDPMRSRLVRLVPRLGNFFTPLNLVEAFREYDAVFALSRRRYIPPNFAELRHIVNIAQVRASAPSLRLITFDADGTLYADGHHFDQDNAMIVHLIDLMKSNVQVAIVTAAGYPGEAERFERRLSGLLEAFRVQKLPAEITDRFHIMGGECNYLLRVTPDTKRLEFVPDDEWKTPAMKAWKEEDIRRLLKDARGILEECGKRLNLQVQVIAKERSVGIVPVQPTIYEVLEDIALTVQNQLESPAPGVLPFCAFNGGNDVFVDVGNKSLGLQSLMAYVGSQPSQTLHVGDRFTLSGNDTATRNMCSVLWVANPEETGFFIKMLLSGMDKARSNQQYIE